MRALIPPVLRTTPWVGFLPAGVLAIAMALVAGQQPLGAEFRFLPTRLAILAIVIAAGFVLDDPAMASTDSAPSPLRRRRLIRAATALLIATTLLAIVVVFASDDMDLVAVIDTAEAIESEPDPSTDVPALPWGRLALEMATMIGFVLAAAAAVARRGEPEPGRIATGALLGAYAVAWMIPESHRPWASPSDQRWETGTNWWWLAFAVLWTLAVLLSWDSRAGWRPARILRPSGTASSSTDIVGSYTTSSDE